MEKLLRLTKDDTVNKNSKVPSPELFKQVNRNQFRLDLDDRGENWNHSL